MKRRRAYLDPAKRGYEHGREGRGGQPPHPMGTPGLLAQLENKAYLDGYVRGARERLPAPEGFKTAAHVPPIYRK